MWYYFVKILRNGKNAISSQSDRPTVIFCITNIMIKIPIALSLNRFTNHCYVYVLQQDVITLNKATSNNI